jgi:hypothetical protein
MVWSWVWIPTTIYKPKARKKWLIIVKKPIKHRVKWLPWAKYWYNTTYLIANKITPFKAVYERPLPLLIHYEAGASLVERVETTLESRDCTLHLFKQHFIEAQHHIKQKANQHWIQWEFDECDVIFFQLQLYQKISLTTHRSMKLAPHFYVPNYILQKIGEVAYHLELPPSSKIFLVFHVLKK